MEIRRTANAGVLLRLDQTTILLDGVSQEVKPYLASPPSEVEKLSANWPDAAAFTHIHEDHYDPDFVKSYENATGNTALTKSGTTSVGNIRMDAIPTRHMGRAYAGAEHVSFVMQGSRCVWFLGDAAPQQLKLLAAYPKPDVLIVPFPYLSTDAAIKLVEEYLPCDIVLVHMPSRDRDPDGIWEMVAPAMQKLGRYIKCPEIGENLTL